MSVETTHSRYSSNRSAAATASAGTRRVGAAQAPDVATVRLPQRIFSVFLLVLLGYVALAGRLAYLQVVQHAQYRAVAEDLRERTRLIPARRGVLLDRSGALLVRNEQAASIVLDPNQWYVTTVKGAKTAPLLDTPEMRREAALKGLAEHLPGVDMAALARKLGGKTATGKLRTIDVRRVVDQATADRIAAANLPGVGVLPTTRRVAMNGGLAAHLIGYTDIDGKGLEGLERELETTLRGKPGLLEAEFDGGRRPIPGTIRREVPEQPGRDVLLTLDATLQHDVQTALRKAYVESRADAATAIVLDPKTGDILALANYPTFDVNKRNEFPASFRANRAVTSPYEPGSTLKVVTVAAALEEGKVTPSSMFFCGGSQKIGRRSIRCAHGAKHGSENLTDVIRDSCNIASAGMGRLLGKETLWEYERRFGFGERTECGLPGESRGLLAKPERWSDMQLANVAFGQGISVTPLQLAAAYAVVANDGVYLRPRIVWGTRNADGSDLRPSQPSEARRVVSPEVARQMRQMLQTVVDSGTGKAAAPDGYTAGGKTGTAQVAENGSYRSGKYVASFIGMAPARDPRFVILVSVTAPKGSYYGGTVAGPVFREIVEKALIARRTPHDRPSSSGSGKAKTRKPGKLKPDWDA